jgi:vancomycin permeability regulator SanA
MRFILAIILLLAFESCFFFKASQRKQLEKLDLTKPLDVVIVPGSPLHHGKWDTLLKARIVWSEFLYKKGYTKNILYSGNSVSTAWMEGPSMFLYATQLGIPKENIAVDTAAERETESLFLGYQLAKKMGFHRIGIACEPFQCELLKRYAKNNVSDKLSYFPIIYDSIIERMKVHLEIDTTLTRRPNFYPH